MTDTSPAKVPELLSPAGTPESLRAALAAGADAVYFGASVFSNRMRARNFSVKELKENIRLCHSCGARAHITVNTRIRDREIAEALALVDELYSGNPKTRPDALIVADLGLASLIRKNHPSAVLHASTQTSLSSAADCRFLSENGFSRLVLPRELSLEEISAVSANPYGIETEMFLHGALCVSLSGQCLLSFVMGGRSGNRGECAQPCRLKYSCAGCREQEILSLSDLNLASHITEIISSGVSSLKIEGRLRSPEYVFEVTSVYRKLLDEKRNATKKELARLASAFTRTETDGYFINDYSSLAGEQTHAETKSPDTAEINGLLKARAASFSEKHEDYSAPVVPLSAHFSLKKNRPASLHLSDGIHSASSQGAEPRPADGAPATSESVYRNLSKLGDSEFGLDYESVTFDMDDGLWISSSELNALRRDAVTALLEDIRGGDEIVRPVPDRSFFRSCEIAEIAVFESDFDGPALRSLADSFDRIFVYPEHLGKFLSVFSRSGTDISGKTGILFPVIPPDPDRLSVMLASARESGIGYAMCHTPGEIAIAAESGFRVTGSYRCNLTNSPACSVYEKLGCDSVILSPELPSGGVRNIGKTLSISVGCVVYGNIPCMTTARCVLCGGNCVKGNTGGRDPWAHPHFCMDYISDRKGERFPVIGAPDCSSVIYNSTPVWMADRIGDVTRKDGRSFHHFIFTMETGREAARIISDYELRRPGAGRRI